MLARKADPAAVGAPRPTADLAAGTASYKGTIAAGGQNMPISVTRTVKEDAGTWVVTDNANLPMGQALDTTVVDKVTLVVTKRTVKQGPVEIDVAFKDGKAAGTFSMNGQSKPIAADLGGPSSRTGRGRRTSWPACRSPTATPRRTATSTCRSRRSR
jgi:hypothetical protein